MHDLNLSGAGIGVFGDNQRVSLNGVNIYDSSSGLEVFGASDVTVNGLKHYPDKALPDMPKTEPKRPKKYFGGFSFSKGDHLKD